ncbi:ABC transporter permease [Microbacterium stercoris]|uniref:ABC transporter permease n=1 Tax=Microbacterium stercoris TaxID=2820289 RepID=A0A939QQE5_9MICO|nr:ABC transporter permease [Microbacterium stercoris]MBO3663576.1 ABC transporter permease [Microbacterium stercoris]
MTAVLDAPAAAPAPPTAGARTPAERPFWLNPGDILALAFAVFLLVAVFFPQALSPWGPLEASPGNTLLPPSLEHPFGTDYLGRDSYTRVVHGTALTLSTSGIAVVIGLVIGIALGSLAGYLGGSVDALISRVVDVLLAIPGLLLAMVIVVSLGFGALNAAIAVGLSSVAGFTRLVRSEVLTVRELTFVEASAHLGGTRRHTLLRHVLPNSYGSVLALVPLEFGGAILSISALSFLGFGAVPPEPEWGLLVSEGRQYITSSPWLALIPGVVIAGTVLAVARLSTLAQRAREARA